MMPMKNEVDFGLDRNASFRARGFHHPAYAKSLAEFGHPRLLPNSGGWILERSIPGFPFRDAMGPYPLFCCERWDALPTDMSDLQSDLVSLALVTDPFGRWSPFQLANGALVRRQ